MIFERSLEGYKQVSNPTLRGPVSIPSSTKESMARYCAYHRRSIYGHLSDQYAFDTIVFGSTTGPSLFSSL